MVEANNWSQVNPSEAEGFDLLGPREQRAAIMAARGIASWERTFDEPKPMRVAVTPENPFNLKAFAGFMHSLQVGIAESLTQEEDGAFTFQPKPYAEEFHAAMLEGASEKLSRKARRVSGVSEIDDLLETLRRFNTEGQ